MALSRDFFEGLGYLTYAMAYADGEIEREEVKRFAEELLNRFGSWDTQGTRARAAFELAVQKKYSPDQALEQAQKCLKWSKKEVAEKKEAILQTLKDVLRADRKEEAAELAMLKKIETLLNSL